VQTNKHLDAGMMAQYTVAASSSAQQAASGAPVAESASQGSGSVVRRYYVAAEPVEWDFAPLGGDACAAAGAADGGEVEPFANGTFVFGTTFSKAQYVEYEDAAFLTKRARPAEEAYLGLLGPVLRAEVSRGTAG
jgi:hephaestin